METTDAEEEADEDEPSVAQVAIFNPVLTLPTHLPSYKFGVRGLPELSFSVLTSKQLHISVYSFDGVVYSFHTVSLMKLFCFDEVRTS